MASTVCGWCGRLTHMTISSSVVQLPDEIDSGTEHKNYMAAFRCDSEQCGRLSLGMALLYRASGQPATLQSALSERPNLSWTPRRVRRPSFPDVPDQIAETAAEAHACLSVDAYRGAVALARAVVEATAKEKGITSGPLVKKIDALHAAGHIREITREVAHEIREGGNEIAHGDLADEPMPAEDAEAIVALMDEILEEVYQGPARMLALQKSRLEREKRNAEKKQGSY
ncbi:DUF4145 domain-containing protein [Streptomyces sp. NPDC059255]|uniref:DUF4145 domain-containing protein n=1 Tax=Streptomyces sp. NPDC059255 TaxID=3346793 RepID=UPI0036B16015